MLHTSGSKPLDRGPVLGLGSLGTERINNLHHFSFIYYPSLNDNLFWKHYQIISVTSIYGSTLDASQSALCQSRETLLLKLNTLTSKMSENK